MWSPGVAPPRLCARTSADMPLSPLWPWHPALLLLFYTLKSFLLHMSATHHHSSPHPSQPEWHIYSFEEDHKPVLVFSTQPVLRFPGGKRLDLKAKSNEAWDPEPWEAFNKVSADNLSRLQHAHAERRRNNDTDYAD